MPALKAIISGDADPLRKELLEIQRLADQTGRRIQSGISGGGHGGVNSGAFRESLVVTRELMRGDIIAIKGKYLPLLADASIKHRAEHSPVNELQRIGGFRPYKTKMKEAMPGRLDFAQFYKEHNMQTAIRMGRSPRSQKAKPYLIRAGNPDINLISTAHIERANLSVRHFNRRFTRKTISFSKAKEFLAYSVYLFVANYNFCKVHKGILGKQTPAMASGLADVKWDVCKLLTRT